MVTKLVLLIDDNPNDILILSTLLEREGHVTTSINNGNYVLDAIREHCPHVVVCDVFMEDKEGVETLMTIKEHYPDLPVIMISVESVYFPILKTFGAHDCVLKTATYSQLINIINNL